ncbi:hypothetical protein C2S51_026369 [Perilla frutescens var. frutescens]|nr:hypothetical protein C2S51_026369 [Perilla frutescens var. frutescens]
MHGRLTPEANMDFISAKEREIVIDIEGFIDSSREIGTPALADETIGNVVSISVCGVPVSVDEVVRGETKAVGELSPGQGKSGKREKGKPVSVKKSPKPPRPPRGLSLDAADQKLIKEISELAMIKRAKIERMKALKKIRAAKASSYSSSSSSTGGNLMAILFTVIFFAVIILQGCHTSGTSRTNKSSVPIQGSLESSMFTSGVPLTSIESPNIMQRVPGSDIAKAEAEESVH